MPAVRSRDSQPKARSDAYTGLLLLALLAQVAGAVFLYIDWSRYPATAPEKPQTLAAAPLVSPGPAAPAGNPAVPANPAQPAAPGAVPPGGPGAAPVAPPGGPGAPPAAK